MCIFYSDSNFFQLWKGVCRMLEEMKKTIFKIAIYIRLSKEDMDRGFDESESITNQKALLLDYVEKLGFEYELYDIYILTKDLPEQILIDQLLKG